jgi:hypothetical protein
MLKKIDGILNYLYSIKNQVKLNFLIQNEKEMKKLFKY